MKKALMLFLPLLGFVGGAIGGDLLQTNRTDGKTLAAGPQDAAPERGTDQADEDVVSADGRPAEAENSPPDSTDLDWFRFPNQFFVPIIRNGSPTAVMILTLSIEIPVAARPEIEAQEYRLRDALLGALMVAANTGAFDGNFTSEASQRNLRASLLAAGQKASGPDVLRVLIEDIGRQEQ
ncbi:hypothetical protein IT41_00085 [Paracoccus halophilus]|uniref:Flagellar basal body-associated protein FliL n=1 Tax=Paracoccus halophilus TaxID=376733 RepID=A0A099F8Q9_9RHOB|nr:hypothetical protein IT41_00085 [Paracoccus halophilus]